MHLRVRGTEVYVYSAIGQAVCLVRLCYCERAKCGQGVARLHSIRASGQRSVRTALTLTS